MRKINAADTDTADEVELETGICHCISERLRKRSSGLIARTARLVSSRGASFPFQRALLMFWAMSRSADTMAAALRVALRSAMRDRVAALIEAVGAANVVDATHTGAGRFASIRAMVEADVLGWLPLMGVEPPSDVVRRVFDEADQALGTFVEPDGTVVFDSSAHINAAVEPG